ncbi:S-DNA-T family DNA segregation ATPase FtsK/SpoIIIE [Kibdelosporangium banguiense]|uniref:S-DNA-T family DNA segregation ATPase FtsK/SpoIIIE n=1 Tax=Kibdelosporangium banguiense TaxID=1365924 RepID=A0ABS4U360_9PSEU|nr:zonular occludens toxin domain-containing protein [Kibdelosporangium banguiense]MBP2330623.1 S-DNA-T family DNA segregation ATPase FtsK/SpoIIIE [Kibdelosporangium banguiense]
MTDNTPRSDDLADVHYLHTPEVSPAESAGEPLEGELISEEEYQRLTSQKAQALARYQGYRNDITLAVRVARTAVTHPRTKTTSKAVARNAWYPVAGAGIVLKRWRDGHSGSRYERLMRAAEAAGDQEGLRYWQEQDVAEKQRRHDRVMDWVTAPWKLVKAMGAAVVSLIALLLVLGIILAVADDDFRRVIDPIVGVMQAIRWSVWFATAYGLLMILGATGGVLAYLWHLGRTHSAWEPKWMAMPDQAGDVMDALPDEGTILKALKHLRIPGFTQAVKEGWQIRFRMPPTIDGKGWRAQIDLPPACPVEEIVKRKPLLAHNLLRFPTEVWPTEPQAGVLDLWVAKSGALSGPVDPWPLLADLDNASCDYFTGVPVGVTIKGDVVRGRLFEANYVVGGMMGSGKSTLIITLLLGAILDPLVDVDVVVMAENADYEAMKPRLRSLVTGAGDDTVEACLGRLHELYDELTVRGQALREHDARAVTRELAERDERLRPRVMVIDECQNLFMGEHGKPALEVAVKVMSTARKYAITLVFLTPEPSKDALPRKLITVATNKACFAIGDHQGNDSVLGSGSYKAGISAVGLEPKTDESNGDVGTCMCRGFMAKPGLLRSFYVPQADAHRVTQRALQLREHARIIHTPPREITAGNRRDPLDDLAAVLGDQRRMRTQEVLQKLAERDPAGYRGWTFERLTAFLAEHDATPYKTGGHMHVRADDVHAAITRRDELAALADPGEGPEI